MTLIVLRESGEETTIEIVPPLVVSEGDRLNQITDATGVEYFFTKDGHYDGWGRAVSLPRTMTLREAVAFCAPPMPAGGSR